MGIMNKNVNPKELECIGCYHKGYELKEVKIETPVSSNKKKTVKVTTDAYVCPNCGNEIMTTDQMNVYRQKIKEAENNLNNDV